MFLLALWDRLAPLAPYLLAGFVLELLLTADPTVTADARLFNLGCAVVFWTADVLIGASVAVSVWAVVSRLPGHGWLTIPLPQNPSLALVIAVAFGWIVAGDFFYYWMHRAQHSVAWLWAEHEVHHADPAMNVTTTWRHHWLEKPLQAVCIVGPMSYLCTPPIAVVAMSGVLSNLIVHFIHTNTRVSLGRFNWIVGNPQHHRIHHSIEPAHLDRNFAAIWPLWDVLFGTYCAPQPGEYPRTGLHSGRQIPTVTAAALWPFYRWLGLRRH